jgi:hypothetical protein
VAGWLASGAVILKKHIPTPNARKATMLMLTSRPMSAVMAVSSEDIRLFCAWISWVSFSCGSRSCPVTILTLVTLNLGISYQDVVSQPVTYTKTFDYNGTYLRSLLRPH